MGRMMKRGKRPRRKVQKDKGEGGQEKEIITAAKGKTRIGGLQHLKKRTQERKD